MDPKKKKLLITLAKIAIALVILGGLIYSAAKTQEDRDAFVKMLVQEKHWGLLAAGCAILLSAVLITIVRWCYLVRALGISFSVADSMRIGFLGYLFNLAPMGIVGGDLLKAWMLSREKPGTRARAFASVIVDRIVGLYVLLLVATAGVFIARLWDQPDPNIQADMQGISWAVLIVTFVATVGISLVMIPGFLEGPLVRWMTWIPKIGPAIDSLLAAIRIYRSKRFVLFVSALMTIPVHGLLTVSMFLLALGLGFNRVPWSDYTAIYPISGILSTIPLPAGPAELGIFFFYMTALLRTAQNVANGDARQQGIILALVYRLTAILIALIGVVYYYLGGRSEVSEVLHEHEVEEQGEEGKGDLGKENE